jgi:hypothetical protein
MVLRSRVWLFRWLFDASSAPHDFVQSGLALSVAFLMFYLPRIVSQSNQAPLRPFFAVFSAPHAFAVKFLNFA